MGYKCVYLSLGGNQGNALSCLQQALDLLVSKKDSVSELKISHFYRTKPLYFETPHWFVNAACSFWTRLSLEEVYQMTHTIEKRLGKQEQPKNRDRPIDIDILFYGTEATKSQEVEIPHPRWKERLFVLMPLADLTNEIVLHTEEGVERYLVHQLIESLKEGAQQSISLLEKNADFQ